MKTIVAALLLLATPALGQQPTPADSSFTEFFQRFVAEKPFRLDRTANPVKVRLGDPRAGEVRSESWDRKKVSSDLPVPLSAEQLQAEGMEHRVKRHSNTKVEVTQFQPGGNGRLRIYTFQLSKGHWYLTRFDDASRKD